MTQKEAIRAWDKWMGNGYSHSVMPNSMALAMAYNALHGSTREQVEKSWAGCEYCEKRKINLVRIEMNYNDSPGSPKRLNPTRVPKFCPMCDRPLTDEAVDIIMQRLERLYGTENQ